MDKRLYSQIIGPLNKGMNQQANSFILPGFSKNLENANCDLVEGLKKRLGSVPVKRIDNLATNHGGNAPTGTVKWDEAWYFVYNRSTDERFVLIVCDDSSTVTKTCTTTNGSPVVSITSGGTTDLFVGSTVSGNSIPTGAKITELGTNQMTLDLNADSNAGSSKTLTVTSSKTFVSAVANVEPISGILPTVVPIQQVFSGITSTNLAYLRGSGRARDRFRATSFQDFVFITNIQKDVTYDSSETLTRYNIANISNSYVPIKAQVNVKLVDYATVYNIDIELDDGTTIDGTITTPTLASGTPVSTQTIATDLRTNLLADC